MMMMIDDYDDWWYFIGDICLYQLTPVGLVPISPLFSYFAIALLEKSLKSQFLKDYFQYRNFLKTAKAR